MQIIGYFAIFSTELAKLESFPAPPRDFNRRLISFQSLSSSNGNTQREQPDDIGTPLAELCGTDGVDTIAHGNDCIEIVELRVA